VCHWCFIHVITKSQVKTKADRQPNMRALFSFPTVLPHSGNPSVWAWTQAHKTAALSAAATSKQVATYLWGIRDNFIPKSLSPFDAANEAGRLAALPSSTGPVSGCARIISRHFSLTSHPLLICPHLHALLTTYVWNRCKD
jgi:hypothetical protein